MIVLASSIHVAIMARMLSHKYVNKDCSGNKLVRMRCLFPMNRIDFFLGGAVVSENPQTESIGKLQRCLILVLDAHCWLDVFDDEYCLRVTLLFHLRSVRKARATTPLPFWWWPRIRAFKCEVEESGSGLELVTGTGTAAKVFQIEIMHPLHYVMHRRNFFFQNFRA